jgi:hypothetical protein
MPILTSTSRRFSRTLNYSLPQYQVTGSQLRQRRAMASPVRDRIQNVQVAQGL